MLLSPEMLHIPDGFLSPLVAVVGWILALVFIAIAIRQTRDQLGERQVPLMGILAAFIFAAQAINFPLVGGTSGHLLGGALAAIVVGPWGATLIMSAVSSADTALAIHRLRALLPPNASTMRTTRSPPSKACAFSSLGTILRRARRPRNRQRCLRHYSALLKDTHRAGLGRIGRRVRAVRAGTGRTRQLPCGRVRRQRHRRRH